MNKKEKGRIKMKRVWMIFIVLVMAFSVTSCGGADSEPEEKKTVEKAAVSDTADSEEEFSALVLADVDATVAELNEEYEKLTTEINSYDAFVQNVCSKSKEVRRQVWILPPGFSRVLSVPYCPGRISLAEIIAFVASLINFVSPLDVLPDIVPGF